ncbi:PLDc N-terminal domain-containing protein [Amycolatopsis anabasis]|uniref:PLDc N-terminal domain-containing protein n=1 Tax=Amycolatopsis anabasis TaxID=1840409 RepID=UPI00131C69DA|nr:PLDc N-terminal domain-containing protein [Amycolatopsis anabasis]
MPIFGFGAVGLVLLALWIFCIVDVTTTDESDCRNLPKLGWLLIVLLLPEIGSIVWLVAGRPRTVTTSAYRSAPSRFPEYERPGRHVATDPAADEEFLRQCRERAEQQRRAAKRQRPAEDEG